MTPVKTFGLNRWGLAACDSNGGRYG